MARRSCPRRRAEVGNDHRGDDGVVLVFGRDVIDVVVVEPGFLVGDHLVGQLTGSSASNAASVPPRSAGRPRANRKQQRPATGENSSVRGDRAPVPTSGTANTDAGGGPLPARGSLTAVPAVEPEIGDLTPAKAMERVLSEGVHWLGQTDGPTLALAREALEDYTRARLTGDIKLTLAARDQVMKLFGKLGFDPDARARLGLAKVKAQSRVEEIIARRRSRSTQD
jgi:hypothetical protein